MSLQGLFGVTLIVILCIMLRCSESYSINQNIGQRNYVIALIGYFDGNIHTIEIK